MEYLFGTRSGGWQDQDKERAAQAEEERKKAKKEKAKALQEAAKNQPQNLPLPVVNPQVNIPTPPRDSQVKQVVIQRPHSHHIQVGVVLGAVGVTKTVRTTEITKNTISTWHHLGFSRMKME